MTGEDDAGVSTIELVGMARELTPGGFVLIGGLPAAAITFWKDSVTTGTIVSYGARTHYLQRHGEVLDLDRHVIEAVRNPDAIHRDKSDESTANVFRSLDDEYDIVVSIQLSRDSSRYNSVKSARRQRRAKRHRDEYRGLEVWRKRPAGGTVTPA